MCARKTKKCPSYDGRDSVIEGIRSCFIPEDSRERFQSSQIYKYHSV